MSALSSPSQRPPASSKEEQSPQKTKKPSVLFVNYYGVLFLGMVAVFLLAGFFLLRPPLERYKVLQAEAASKTMQLEDERNYLESLKNSIVAAQQIPATVLADVEEALPSEPGIPELLTGLARIAETNQVTLSNIQFTTSESDVDRSPRAAVGGGRAVEALGVSMNLSSPSYATTRRYLDMVERNLRLFDIQTISVSPGQGEEGQVYTIQLQTYVLPPSVRPD